MRVHVRVRAYVPIEKNEKKREKERERMCMITPERALTGKHNDWMKREVMLSSVVFHLLLISLSLLKFASDFCCSSGVVVSTDASYSDLDLIPS